MERTPGPEPHSMIYMPATDEHKIAGIPRLTPAAIILDLEDSVAPSGKNNARLLASQAIARYAAAAGIWVRINCLSDDTARLDIKEVVRPGLSGIILPKVGHYRDVRLADHLIREREGQRSMVIGQVRLMATIESAGAVAQLHSIARAAPRLARLCFGAADFGLDVGLHETDGQAQGYTGLLNYVRYQLVIASRAAGLSAPHDSAYLRVDDPAGLRREAESARTMGFAGKHAIHPAQLTVIEEAFSVPERELERAARIVREFRAAQDSGTAVLVIDGQVVDYPVYVRARRLLAASGPRGEGGASGDR